MAAIHPRLKSHRRRRDVIVSSDKWHRQTNDKISKRQQRRQRQPELRLDPSFYMLPIIITPMAKETVFTTHSKRVSTKMETSSKCLGHAKDWETVGSFGIQGRRCYFLPWQFYVCKFIGYLTRIGLSQSFMDTHCPGLICDHHNLLQNFHLDVLPNSFFTIKTDDSQSSNDSQAHLLSREIRCRSGM